MKEDERWVSFEVGVEPKLVMVDEEEEGEEEETHGYMSFVEAEICEEERSRKN